AIGKCIILREIGGCYVGLILVTGLMCILHLLLQNFFILRRIFLKSVAINHSKTVQTRLVLPPDTNHLDTIFGGKILAYIDEIAALAAMKHANSAVVTASIDSVDFLSAAPAWEAFTFV